MWKAFNHSGDVYLLKSERETGKIKICFTDLKNVWIEDISEETLYSRFQELNPTFDVELEEAISQVLIILENVSKCTEINMNLSDNATILMRYQLEGFGVKYSLQLVPEESSVFLKEIMVPLIHTVKFLEDQESKLCDLIEKRDRELEEYRLEKGDISRSDLVTGKFNRDEVSKSHQKLMLKVFNEPSFWETFSRLHGTCEVKTLEVQKDHWNHMKRKRKVYSSKTSIKRLNNMFKTEK